MALLLLPLPAIKSTGTGTGTGAGWCKVAFIGKSDSYDKTDEPKMIAKILPVPRISCVLILLRIGDSTYRYRYCSPHGLTSKLCGLSAQSPSDKQCTEAKRINQGYFQFGTQISCSFLSYTSAMPRERSSGNAPDTATDLAERVRNLGLEEDLLDESMIEM